MKNLILFVMLATSWACNDAKKEADCSSAANCSDERGPEVTSPVKLKVNFVDIAFYDAKLGRWRKISKEELSAGGMGAEIPIYSDFVNLSKEEALSRVQISAQQAAEPDHYSPNTYNTIPYLELKPTPNTTYVYNYTKIDLSGVEVGGKTGSMIIDGERAFLPFINEMFGGIFFPDAATANQSSFTHRIQIVAQSPNQRASDVYTITFKASLIVPNRDFSVEFSNAMRNITMENRWNYFYDVSDGVPNTDLELATLVESSATPESIPLDIKVVFKNPPKMEMAYTIFDEDMLVREGNNNSPEGTIAVLRGSTFYEKSYVLDSDQHFGMKFKINGTLVPFTNANREAELRNVPAGELWRLTFGYDLTQSIAYPSGKQLLKPLMPICNTISKQPFNPVMELQSKRSYADLGGYLSVCHPETMKRELIAAENIEAPPVSLMDSWYWGFSYMASGDNEIHPEYTVKTAGHLYGIKNIQFRISGCMKIMTREASPAPINPNIYEVKNNSNDNACSSGPGDTGWMYVDISKEVSIFDNIAPFDSDLQKLINTYRNAIPKTTLEFYFNGDTFFEHIH